MTQRSSPVVLFWIIAVLLLFWSLADLSAFLMEATAPDKIAAALDDSQRQVFQSRPPWYLYVTGVATVAGALSAIFLLLRKKAAVGLAIVSLLAVLVSGGYKWFSGYLGADGLTSENLLLLILFFDVIMVVFAVYSKKKRWIV